MFLKTTNDLKLNLCDLSIEAHVVDFTAKVIITQSYINPNEELAEIAYHITPTNSNNMLICGFEATIGKKKLIAISQPLNSPQEKGQKEEDSHLTLRDYNNFIVKIRFFFFHTKLKYMNFFFSNNN